MNNFPPQFELFLRITVFCVAMSIISMIVGLIFFFDYPEWYIPRFVLPFFLPVVFFVLFLLFWIAICR